MEGGGSASPAFIPAGRSSLVAPRRSARRIGSPAAPVSLPASAAELLDAAKGQSGAEAPNSNRAVTVGGLAEALATRLWRCESVASRGVGQGRANGAVGEENPTAACRAPTRGFYQCPVL